MLRIFFGFILSVMLIAFSSCNNNPQPDDLPKLYPCTITITQDGKPLDSAAVELVAADQSNTKYKSATQTNAEGKAVMSTYGYNGTPAGKYKVIVSKKVDEDLVYAPNTSGGQDVVSYKTYQTVETKYYDAKTTPHEIEITGKEKSVKATFDVGKPIKVPF
jgi:hypothetical protein